MAKPRIHISKSAYNYIMQEKKKLIEYKKKYPKRIKRVIDIPYTVDIIIQNRKYGKR